MGANSNAPLRQDVLRGIRWGMILLIAMLMAIAGYRMFGEGAATAAPRIERAPAVPAEAIPPAAIEAGEGAPSEAAAPAVTGPDVPPAPPQRRRVAPPVEQPDVQPKAFIPPSVTAPRAALKQDLVENLPEVTPIEVHAEPLVAGKAVVDTKPQEKGSRAGKLVKSVGRVFGIGRKDPAAPAK